MSSPISHVSDTSFWVCHYRAAESERPDALFNDPYASKLAGDKGRDIAARMKQGKYTAWSVVIRTVIIDNYVKEAVARGIDTVLCLGAGLDARPYRLALGDHVHWIEVDYAHVITYKSQVLANDKPGCRLSRISLDLADRTARQHMFAQVAAKAGKVLVITEGVIPYLSNEQAADLAEDLRAQPAFVNWVMEYLGPGMMAFIRQRHDNNLANAPFKFEPHEWLAFFEAHGWREEAMRYFGRVSRELSRTPPMPWYLPLLAWFPPVKRRMKNMAKMSGYVLLAPR